MEKKYGPNLNKIRQNDKKKKKSQFSGKAGSVRRENLFKAKADERRLKNIDHEIKDLVSQYDSIDPSNMAEFKDFPISVRTLQGLLDANFTTPTDIQRQSIGLALQGCDILGAAKTGSGKTLAFLIPILECLYRQKWSNLDGMGALIISPVRELAYQTFEVLRKIGKKHDFSAGLVIGGKRLAEEAARIRRTNIVICTPGRLLQHMDETAYFEADSLQMLVLDEADRILDLGFAPTMNAIIDNLPPTRQTLLFSATQTKSVKDLARLSLQRPMYVSAHELASHSTPSQLQQHYMVCELHDKFNMLWSFVANHLKSKILVFLATSKQVKFMAEAFTKLRCGLAILSLYGSMDQVRRVGNYESFCRKDQAVLFATDVAARGLDFPEVHWVVQLDCPEDSDTYIHRVGRTARYKDNGQALLLLLTSEAESMVRQLREKRIPIEEIKANPRRVWSQRAKLDSLAAADVDLKTKAQGAFTTYLKCVYLMKDKTVFDYHSLDPEPFARSLGLAITPRVRFVEGAIKRQTQQKLATQAREKMAQPTETVKKSDSGADSGSDNVDREAFGGGSSSEDENEIHGGDLFKIKPSERNIPDVELQETLRKPKKATTKVAVAKKLLKRDLTANKKTAFDKDGKAVVDRLRESATKAQTTSGTGLDICEAKAFMRREDEVDRQIYREKIRKRHREERVKAKEERKQANRHRTQRDDKEGSDGDDPVVTLGNPGSAGDESTSDDENRMPNASRVSADDDDSVSEAEWKEASDDSNDPSEDEDKPSSPPVNKKARKSQPEAHDDRDDDVADGEDDDDDVISHGLSGKDMEELALRLLT